MVALAGEVLEDMPGATIIADVAANGPPTAKYPAGQDIRRNHHVRGNCPGWCGRSRGSGAAGVFFSADHAGMHRAGGDRRRLDRRHRAVWCAGQDLERCAESVHQPQAVDGV